MDMRELRPARDFAMQFGCKALVYGPAGRGKTPIANTAPRPLLLACEPGLLSMRNSTIPTYQAFDTKRIDEFFKWFFNSQETKNFDTICVDSVTQMAVIYLLQAQKENKHGLKAYGEMATKVMEHVNGLYYTMHKHTYLICKQELYDDSGIKKVRPSFPGQVLPIEVPGLFDFILHLDIHNIPGVGQHTAFRCNGSLEALARNRVGNLNDFEPPHLGDLFVKAML